MKQFMTAQTANVATDTEKFSIQNVQTGRITFFVWGTFGGATVLIEISPDEGTTWFATAVSISTSNGFGTVELGPGNYIARANVTGGTAANLNAGVVGTYNTL